MRISPDRRRAAKGVATLEVLVAVTIVVMVGTLGILTFGGTDRALVRAEAAETALFLQEARLRALEAGRPIEILLSPAGLNAGGIMHDFDPRIAVSPEEAQVILQPSGASGGLTIRLQRDDAVATVALNWLTGQVAVE